MLGMSSTTDWMHFSSRREGVGGIFNCTQVLELEHFWAFQEGRRKKAQVVRCQEHMKACDIR